MRTNYDEIQGFGLFCYWKKLPTHCLKLMNSQFMFYVPSLNLHVKLSIKKCIGWFYAQDSLGLGLLPWKIFNSASPFILNGLSLDDK